MDYHTIIVNTVLSFKAPFTCEEVMDKIKEKVEITEENKVVIKEKVKEILNLTAVRNVPLTNKYYFIGTASDPNQII